MKKLVYTLYFFLFLIVGNTMFAQGVPDIFNYQGIARNSLGAAIINQNITVKAGIYSGSGSGTLVWEETFAVTTDANGLYVCKIGIGVSTGVGSLSAFNLISWQNNNYFLAIAIDYGSGYVVMGNAQLMSVPYAFYANQSNQITGLSINDLIDADTAGIAIGKILKWNGTNWMPATDKHHDTVLYALNLLSPGWSPAGDTVTGSNYLGTNNAEDLTFKSNNTERMRITANGQWAVGTSSPIAQVQFVGNDGFQVRGDTLSGALCDSSAGTRMMWYPHNAALRLGQVTNTSVWGNSKIGKHSFAEGLNCEASGRCSVSMGINNKAKGLNCISIGRNNYTSIDSGAIAYGGLVAIGDSNYVNITRGVAIGYHNRSEDGISIGYQNRTRTGSSSAAFGKDNTADGFVSIAFGTKASSATLKGCFIFADAAGGVLYNTAINQFMVRASGGVVFYSDTALQTGVQLFPGAGSWSSVSDRRKKANFTVVNTQEILDKICELKITKWNYLAQSRRIHHIGPMAQDFYTAFNFGENNYTIGTVDMDGVCMAGIKALEQTTRALAEKINQIETIKEELKTDANFDALESRLDRIEKTLNNR